MEGHSITRMFMANTTLQPPRIVDLEALHKSEFSLSETKISHVASISFADQPLHLLSSTALLLPKTNTCLQKVVSTLTLLCLSSYFFSA